jgi:hypothetical protein
MLAGGTKVGPQRIVEKLVPKKPSRRTGRGAGRQRDFLLMPRLPMSLRHSYFKEDLGLVVDFAICTIVFVGVKLARR